MLWGLGTDGNGSQHPREECAAEKIRGHEGGGGPCVFYPNTAVCKANKARKNAAIIISLLFLNEIVGAPNKTTTKHRTDF
jgi:hypothetical protein